MLSAAPGALKPAPRAFGIRVIVATGPAPGSGAPATPQAVPLAGQKARMAAMPSAPQARARGRSSAVMPPRA